MFDISNERSFANIVNTSFLLIHTSLIFLFLYLKANIMVGINVASVMTYLVNYFIIAKNRISVFVKITYVEIWLHLLLAVIFVGTGFGFQYYCFPMIPVVFYYDYLRNKVKKVKINIGLIVSYITLFVYLGAMMIEKINGAVYQTDKTILKNIILCCNITATFICLSVFMKRYTKIVIDSEKNLQDMAEKDELTKMYNRFYMNEKLSKLDLLNKDKKYWVAILDIDDFKKVNDNYGHNGGDFVLKKIASIIRKYSNSYISCRWGGEEFLLQGVCDVNENDFLELLDGLRKKIQVSNFIFNKLKIDVTVTIGGAIYVDYMNIDSWIRTADDCLYKGKNKGKNCVICDDNI